MSEPQTLRDVAELIGWTAEGREEWYTTEWRKPGGDLHVPGFGPGVDDMLQWLHTRGWCLSFAADNGPVFADEYTVTMEREADQDWHTVTAPTLREAVEQIVRKVEPQHETPVSVDDALPIPLTWQTSLIPPLESEDPYEFLATLEFVQMVRLNQIIVRTTTLDQLKDELRVIALPLLREDLADALQAIDDEIRS